MNEKSDPRKSPAAGPGPASPLGGSRKNERPPSDPPRHDGRLHVSSDPSMLPEGSRFGGYLVGPCIGEGGMARVYRAQHEGLQRQVALKVLLDGHSKDSEGHERFLREARIVAAIKHPNVVNIFDVGVHQGRPYLVMELLEGMDLEAYVASQGPLEEATLMDVIIPIVAGLAAVHDAGIVHRDLKPGNIFLARGRNDEMEPKLLDFGISKSSGPDKLKLTTSKGLLMGTPFYMSPEASQGLDMTALSDQYALGVVLYEAATGTNPFAGATTFGEVVRQVTTGDYPPVATRNPKLSKRMIGIIERAMHLDPARRFPDMRAMGRELLGLAGQRTRITWGLSFSEMSSQPSAGGSSPKAVSSPLATPAPRRDSQRPPTQPQKSARRFVLPAALVAAAAVTTVWLRWPAPEAESVAWVDASPAPQQAIADLRSVPTVTDTPREPAPGVLDVTSAPVEREENEPIAQIVETETPEPPSAAPVEAPRRAEPERASPPRRVASVVRPRTVRARRAPARAAASTSPTDAPPTTVSTVEPGPDWVISSRQAVQSGRGTVRGTNNAPILD